MKELRRFFVALAYFTRIPVPGWVGWAPDELNRSARYFPLVGVVVAAVVGGVFWLASQLLPPPLAVLLSMAASLRLTGAFHEDGLADTADGLGGGWQRDEVLRIMKDSRIGTYGSAALGMALLTKFASLDFLAAQGWGVIAALFVAHTTSRLAALLVMPALPYVRDEDSRAKPVAQGVGTVEVLVGLASGMVVLALAMASGALSVTRTVVMLAVAGVIVVSWLRLLRRRLGGYTGDCLGAIQQCVELACYAVFCAHAPAWASL